MKRSTTTGADGTDMLNPHAMRSLKADIRGLFMDMSETEFELTWRSVSVPLLLLVDTCDTPKEMILIIFCFVKCTHNNNTS